MNQLHSIASEERPPIGIEAPSAERGLGVRVARGMSWLMVATISSKVISVVGQWMLSWLLAPDAWGLIALAFTVTALVEKFQNPGIDRVLVNQSSRWNDLASSAFWLSIICGVLGSLVILATAPLASSYYDEQRLRGVLFVLALGPMATTLRLVPRARLMTDLRYATLAKLEFFAVVCQFVLSISLAFLGFGVYSFAIPLPMTHLIVSLATWYCADAPLPWKGRLTGWRELLGSSSLLFIGDLALIIIAQGDYFILGSLYGASLVGIYYFGFSISTQTLRLFSKNLLSVLLPALSRLENQPKRQLAAYLRAARVLALVAIPLCLLQAMLADPLIRLVFAEKWYAAIPVIQLLSIGKALQLVGSSGGSLIHAQGRYALKAVSNVSYAVVFLLMVIPAALTGDWMYLVWAVAVFLSFMGPVHLYLSIRASGGSWSDVLAVYGWPTVIATLASLVAWSLCQLVGGAALHPVWQLLVIATSMMASYVWIIRACDKVGVAYTMEMIQNLFRKS